MGAALYSLGCQLKGLVRFFAVWTLEIQRKGAKTLRPQGKAHVVFKNCAIMSSR